MNFRHFSLAAAFTGLTLFVACGDRVPGRWKKGEGFSGEIGQSTSCITVNNGPLAPGCDKIDGREIGVVGIQLTTSTGVVTITRWIPKDDHPDTYIGFDYTVTGGSVQLAVKAGTEVLPVATAGTWINPNGTSGRDAKAISNIVACGGRDGGGGSGSNDGGTTGGGGDDGNTDGTSDGGSSGGGSGGGDTGGSPDGGTSGGGNDDGSNDNGSGIDGGSANADGGSTGGGSNGDGNSDNPPGDGSSGADGGTTGDGNSDSSGDCVPACSGLGQSCSTDGDCCAGFGCIAGACRIFG